MEEKDQKIADLEAKLAESEEKVKHWHNLYNERDRQFQSVRQRYHLLNKLQSNYDKKDKLHLAYMQCAELVDENEQLKQQLAEKDKNNLILYSMLYETLEKQGCENVASQIDQMTGFTLDKQAEWFKGNRNCDELLKLLAEKEKEIERLNYKLEEIDNNKEYKEEIFSEQLFETEEEAEWHKEFGCIERTERLELPTWEEFNKQPEFYFDYYTLIKINDKILLKDSFEDYVYKEFTKENYTFACRKAKQLFLGE